MDPNTIRSLRSLIEAPLLAGGSPLEGSLADGDDALGVRIPSGSAELDAALGGGLPLGDLLELCSARSGEGAFALALHLAARAAEAAPLRGRAVVVVEAEAGRDEALLPAAPWPERALLVRCSAGAGPQRARGDRRGGRGRGRLGHDDAARALVDRVLRCPGVAVTVARLERMTLVESMRLRHAARVGGGLGLVVAAGAGLGRASGGSVSTGRVSGGWVSGGWAPTAAAVRLEVRRRGFRGARHVLEVEVARVRNHPGAGAVVALEV